MRHATSIITIFIMSFLVTACDVKSVFSNIKSKEDFTMSSDSLSIQKDLINSVRYRNIEELKSILEKGVSPNVMVQSPLEESGEILLILSLLNSSYPDNEDLTEHAKVIELLLQYGADITARNENGLGVFHLASKNRRMDVLDMLLLSGADPEMKDKYGRNALFYSFSIDTSEILLSKGVGSIDEKDKWGNTLLHKAVTSMYSSLEFIEWLSDRVDINELSNSGQTALLKSMAATNPLLEVNEITKTLISKGAVLSGTNKEGQSILILALRRGDINSEIIDLLLANNINMKTIDKKGLTAIHYAVNKPVYLLSLINAGANINVKTLHKGRTPLMLAILVGENKQVDLLIKNNALINDVDKTGRTALNHANDINNTHSVSVLNKAGAITSSDEVITAATKAYDIEKKRPKNLNQAIIKKDLELTKKFYHSEEDSGDLDVVSAGFKSVKVGFLEGLKFLLDNELSLNDLDEGYSLLHDAAFYNQLEVAKYLINEGLDPNFVNKNKQSVFLLTANSSVEMYEYLVAHGMKFNIEYDSEIVSEAIEYNSYDLARAYIKQGYTFNKDKFFDPDFLEDKVVRKQDVELLHLLIEQGFDINTRFNSMLSPVNLLTLSMKLGANDLIEPILKAGIDVNEYIDNKSIIKIAISEGRLETVKLLLKYHPKLNLNKMGSDHFDSQSNALLESLDKQYQSMIMYFLDQDINFNQVEAFQRSALHLAAKIGAKDLMNVLLDKGINYDLQDNWGNTALIYAVSKNHDDVINLILERNPDVNLKNNDGNTSLHLASRDGMLNVVKQLISSGASTSKNNKDKTPVDLARLYDHLEIVELLSSIE